VFVREQVEELRAHQGIQADLAVYRGRARGPAGKLLKYLRLHARAWAAASTRHDLAHLHYASPAHLIAAWPALLLRRAPLVVTLHRGELYALPRRGARRELVRFFLRRAGRLIAVSADLGRQLAGELGLPAERIAIIDVGCDTRRFRPCLPRDKAAAKARLGLDPARPHLLFVGRLTERKGIDLLLEAAARLPCPPRSVLLVVGSGPLRERLERASSGLAPVEVRWLGERDHAELPAWFAAADAMVLPSRSEGRPAVVLEAMASGTPVVASRVGGTGELIEDGVNGLLFESQDAPALARALERLIGDLALGQRLAERALADVREHSLERQAARIAAIYRDVGGR
jgi:D-inositol-3-phosphate glycosyltransferase